MATATDGSSALRETILQPSFDEQVRRPTPGRSADEAVDEGAKSAV
jgi:hypothetical protein